MLSSEALKNQLARFGQCQLDCNSGYLEVSGSRQNLEPLVFQFLLLLIRHQGEVVAKKQVIESLWPERTPNDEALRAMVKKAREALKDDARNPSYIKTIPTKGYLLIPNVELSSTVIQSWFRKNKKRNIKWMIFAGLLVTFTIIAIQLLVVSENNRGKAVVEVRITKTEIAQLNSIEVSTHYINGSLKNIYKERLSDQSVNSLIIQDVMNKEQLNLVFPNAQIGSFWWSKYSNRLLVTRNDEPGFFLVQFNQMSNQLHEQPTITLQKFPLQDKYQVIALNYTGTQLFVVQKANNELSRFDFASGEVSAISPINAILSNISDDSNPETDKSDALEPQPLNPQNSTTQNSTTQNSTNSEIVNIWPSPTSSHYIAIVQSATSAQLLLVDDAEEDRIISQQRIPLGVRDGVWDQTGKKFSFTDELGALFSYQMAQDKITSWNTGGTALNGLLADCGDSCFIVANTHGLPKLALLGNPFNTDYSYAQVISSNRYNRHESLPYFTQGGVYFITQTQAGSQLMIRAKDGSETVVYKFGVQDKIGEFVIHDDQALMVGLLNNRPFSLNMNSQQLTYLNISYPDPRHFRFDNAGKLSFYASPPNQTSGRYLYDIASKQITLVSPDVIIDYPVMLDLINDTKATSNQRADSTIGGVSNKLRARFRITVDNKASLTFRGDKPALALGKLAHTCASCFHIHDNYLYFIDHNKRPSLARVNLFTAEKTQVPLGLPGLISHFSMSQNGETIALTMRQNLQTNLLKIEGFSQVY